MRRITIAGLLALLCACAGSSEEAKPVRTADITSVTVLTSDEVSPAATRVDKKVAEQIGEPQALGLVIALDRSFIAEGTLAETKASDPRVKKLAGRMVTDHTTMLDRTRYLARRHHIVPAESDKSRQLTTESQQRMRDLDSLSGPAFDAQYVYDQVGGHIEALVLLDAKVLPNITNGEIATQVEKDKTRMLHHLAEAKDLQRRLSPSFAISAR